MTERPILFSTNMVQAILQGRKTQTRRATGLDEINMWPSEFNLVTVDYVSEDGKPRVFGAMFQGIENPKVVEFVKYPYGKPGDRLWVRETWAKSVAPDGENTCYYFRADEDGNMADLELRWKPSIHMPKAAARIWLEVEEVRVERLQEISEEDAIAEGVEWSSFDHPGDGSRIYYNYLQKQPQHLFAVPSYQSLWQSINGPGSWEQNPFVWVIKFKRVEP